MINGGLSQKKRVKEERLDWVYVREGILENWKFKDLCWFVFSHLFKYKDEGWVVCRNQFWKPAKEGMRVLLKLGFQDLELEGDSQQLVKTILHDCPLYLDFVVVIAYLWEL